VTVLLLARHGETDWNAEGRLQGHTDRPLNEHGRRQAAALAARLARERIDAVVASDLARARETAEIVAERLGLRVTLDPDLRERDWGTWEGLTASERERVALASETGEQHRTRILAALERIAARHPDGRVLVVTHGGSMRRAQAFIIGVALPVVDNCATWTCSREAGTWRAID
jgi:broad specificity phosphatase PhoE